MDKKNIAFIVIAFVIGGSIGYVAHPAPAAAPASNMARANFTGMRGGAQGGGFLTGTVAAQDSGSITLNTRDGSSHVVLITPDTAVSKSVNGTITDIATGVTIQVSGTINSDGSVSANLIQLRPATAQSAARAQ